MSHFDSQPVAGEQPAAPPASGGSFFSKMTSAFASNPFSASGADSQRTPTAQWALSSLMSDISEEASEGEGHWFDSGILSEATSGYCAPPSARPVFLALREDEDLVSENQGGIVSYASKLAGAEVCQEELDYQREMHRRAIVPAVDPQELCEYLSAPRDPDYVEPLIWWMTNHLSFPTIAKAAADILAAQASSSDLARKEKELQDLEANLARKEQELAQQEAQSGVEHRNFPPFWPLIHHDIANDIPMERRAIQRAAFFSWMGIMICLLYNLVCATASWIAGTFDFTAGIGNFFLALIYLLAGVPLSYVLWYKPLYTAMKKQGFVSFTLFFFFYTVNIAFCIFATIGPPFLWNGSSFAGFMSAVSILGHGWTVVGIMYFVGAGLFAAETALSIYVIGRVYAHFRTRKQ